MTRVLISEGTNRFAADLVETREIDQVLVVGKTEPQRIFELLGRKGEVAEERLKLRDAFDEALACYCRKRVAGGPRRFRELPHDHARGRTQQSLFGADRPVSRHRTQRRLGRRLCYDSAPDKARFTAHSALKTQPLQPICYPAKASN
jgi:hypothetical protein